jgi:hypothetical protein
MCKDSCSIEPTSCCCHSHFRKFLTKEEQIKQLEEYADELQNELKAVNEHINELKK